jgi:hypothetical protein
MLIFRALFNRRLVDQHFVDQHFVETYRQSANFAKLDQQFVDQHFVDRQPTVVGTRSSTFCRSHFVELIDKLLV